MAFDGIRTAPEILSKTPDEVLLRQVQFPVDEFEDDEEITSITSVVVTPPDELVVSDEEFSGTQVQMTLSAGELGADYDILITVGTSLGQTIQANVRMTVRSP